MKHLFIAISALTLFNCSHKITRIGYELDQKLNQDCEIKIVRDEDYNEKEKIGELKIGDTGFSTSCSEADAVNVIKKEGCKAGANIANIVKEKRADVWSTCYRAKIEFYKISSDSIISKSAYYSEDNIKERTSDDKKRNMGIMIGALIGGFLVGFLLFQ